MKFLLIIFLALNSNFLFSSSFEDKILYHYKNIELQLNAGTYESNSAIYNFLGISYLNGFFEEKYEGKKYWAYFDADADKACLYFTKSYEMGDKLGGGLLGMLYLNGTGCNKDLKKAIKLLKPVRLDYVDTASSYGLAIHELIRNDESLKNKLDIKNMIESLEFGAKNNQIPALNSLYQLYTEGKFVNTNQKLANEYRKKAKKLIDEKIRLQNAINDATSNLQKLNATANNQKKIGDRKKFLFSLGIIATAFYFSQPAYQNDVCTVSCSPPSAVELMNWGIL